RGSPAHHPGRLRGLVARAVARWGARGMSTTPDGTVRRGTSNSDARGGTPARRARRAWLLMAYASDVPGFCRCYRCGGLLFNPDDMPVWIVEDGEAADGTRLAAFPDPKPEPGEPVHNVAEWVRPLTIDRIIPGCQGGTYR